MSKTINKHSAVAGGRCAYLLLLNAAMAALLQGNIIVCYITCYNNTSFVAAFIHIWTQGSHLGHYLDFNQI